MKKFLALLLALLMVCSLFACGDKAGSDDTDKDNNTPPANTDGDKTDDNSGDTGDADAAVTPHMNDDGSMNLDMIGYWDSSFDYASGPSYKICYMASDASVLYQQSADAVETWAPRFNMEWQGFVSSNGDSDLFLTNLQTYLDQGVDIFLLDPDNTIFPAVEEIFQSYPDAVYMGNMGTPRDGASGEGIPSGGNMLHPFAGKDYYGAGVLCGQKLYDWRTETYPDAKPEEVGAIFITFSSSPQLHLRYQGAWDKYTELAGSDNNCFTADAITFGLGVQAGMDATSPIITTNSDIKYWLVFGLVDDLAQGTAAVIDQVNLTDTSCCVAIGGAGLQTQCDAGQYDSFRYAYFTSYFMAVEPMMGAMYAFKRGWCTEDEIWPSWVKKNDHGGEGHTFGSLYIPAIWIGQNDYFDFLEWVDLYSGGDYYHYDSDVTIDAYDPYPEVPEGWLD